MTTNLHAYGCGSPIRLPVIQALAKGSRADFFPNANPKYLGGDSIVWGLIRGADQLMLSTRTNGCNYYQVDNAYFGRNLFYRVTPNALQFTGLPREVLNNRHELILKLLGKNILPWNKSRNGPIVICPSSEMLYRFYGTTLTDWISEVTQEIQKQTDRPIYIRFKEISPSDDIDELIRQAWCVVTHVSAAALDSLRMGVPVVTTGVCAASALATPLSEIENPILPNGREALFSLLANAQFTLEEMSSNNIIDIISSLATDYLNVSVVK